MNDHFRLLLIGDSNGISAALKNTLPSNGDLYIEHDFEKAVTFLDKRTVSKVICNITESNFRNFSSFISFIKKNNPNIYIYCSIESCRPALCARCLESGADEIVHINNLSAILSDHKNGKRYSFNNRKLKSINPSKSQFVGKSETILQIKNDVQKVLKYEPDIVLVYGESGVGKDLFARLIYEQSSRFGGPFVNINCAALPEYLIESELFGHERGSYTGASNTEPGKFELANNGMLILNEISELPFHMQTKLLHILENKKFYRVGGHHQVESNFMIIALTNQNLVEMVKRNRFRKDLFFRINKIFYKIPPLRKRKEDIPLLVEYYLNRWQEEHSTNVAISRYATKKLMSYNYPGNVRELFNTLESALIHCNNDIITKDDILFFFDDTEENVSNYLNKECLKAVLNHSGGNITVAARRLGYTREGLSKKVKKMNLL